MKKVIFLLIALVFASNLMAETTPPKFPPKANPGFIPGIPMTSDVLNHPGFAAFIGTVQPSDSLLFRQASLDIWFDRFFIGAKADLIRTTDYGGGFRQWIGRPNVIVAKLVLPLRTEICDAKVGGGFNIFFNRIPPMTFPFIGVVDLNENKADYTIPLVLWTTWWLVPEKVSLNVNSTVTIFEESAWENTLDCRWRFITNGGSKLEGGYIGGFLSSQTLSYHYPTYDAGLFVQSPEWSPLLFKFFFHAGLRTFYGPHQLPTHTYYVGLGGSLYDKNGDNQ